MPMSLKSHAQKTSKFLAVITEVKDRFAEATKGDYNSGKKEVMLMVRVLEACNEFKQKLRDGTPDFLSEDYSKKAHAELETSRGVTLSDFLPTSALKNLLQPVIHNLLPKLAKNLVNNVMFHTASVLCHHIREVCPQVRTRSSLKSWRSLPKLGSWQIASGYYLNHSDCTLLQRIPAP